MKKQVRALIAILALILAMTAALVSCDDTNTSPETTATQIEGTEATADTTATPNAETTATLENTETTTAHETTEAPHVHAWSDWNTTLEATCTTEGKQERSCSCGEIESQAIPTSSHTEVIDQAVAPTCTSTGLTEGKHCSVCNQVLIKQETVNITGHTEVVDQAVTPTCTATGLTEGKHCSVCNTVLIAQQTVSVIAHTFDDKYDDQCNVCGYKRDAECAHVETEVIREKSATCTENGLTDGKKCKQCGEILVAQSVISAKGHTLVLDAAVAATCEKDGKTAGKHCSDCNTVLVAQRIVKATGHTYSEWKTTKAATCTAKGEQQSTCSCGKTEIQSIAALGHNEVIDKAIAPTCSKIGLTEGKHCSVCSIVIVAQKEVAKTAHIYGVWVQTIAPSCTTNGAERRDCNHCDSYEIRELSAIGHVYVSTIVPPTTISEGYTEYKCSCGNSYRDTFVPALDAPIDSTFSIHFIDVGQADAALVECDGHYMLIDGGNKADSNIIYSVLQAAGVEKLDIVVASHAHEDHIGGLSGAFAYTTSYVTLCPVTSYDSDAFSDFAKYAAEKGGGITVPQVNDTYSLGSASVIVLGVNASKDTNDSSIILLIEYGETSFLFTGDAEREAEQAVLARGIDLSATVLKVGHHGSETSTTYPFLREIMPKFAIISVGEGNSYGHPTDDTLSRLRDADVKVYRTDLQGDIFCISDGKDVTITVERNADADTLLPPEITETPDTIEPEGTEYVLNTSSKKFHYPDCASAKRISEKNIAYYCGTREELIKDGYSPCGNCDP